MKRHPASWILWAVSAMTVGLLVRNPWYLLLSGAVAIVVRWRAAGARPGWGTLRLVVTLLVFPAVLNVLFSRAGDTVLLQLPIRWIGGPYTFEALLFGLTAGVQIASLLMVMLAFSALVTPSDLLRRMPVSLAPAGVTASIALTFAPQVRRSFAALREAQQVRGYQPQGLRDLPHLVTPLVILSLEGALAVAEGLAARGWGRGGLRGWRRAMAPAGVLLLGVGIALWALSPVGTWPVVLLLGLGLGLLCIALGPVGGRSRYRPDIWRRRDSLVAGLSLGVAAAFAILAVVYPGTLVYYPYPRATWPDFQWPLALPLLLLSAPAWVKASD